MLGSFARRPGEPGSDKSPHRPSASSSSQSPKPQAAETGKSGEAAAANHPQTQINITPGSNPFNQLGVQNCPARGNQPASTGGTPYTPRKRSAKDVDDGDSASSSRPAAPQPVQKQQQQQQHQRQQQQQQQQQQVESDQDYAHRMLSRIFRVSVDPHEMTDAQGQRLVFLPNLNQELNDAGEHLKLSVGLLDQAIIEACSNWASDQPLLDYLLPCWKRAVKASNTARTASAQRQEMLVEAKRLCMSNCLFALTMPALYGFVFMLAYETSDCRS